MSGAASSTGPTKEDVEIEEAGGLLAWVLKEEEEPEQEEPKQEPKQEEPKQEEEPEKDELSNSWHLQTKHKKEEEDAAGHLAFQDGWHFKPSKKHKSMSMEEPEPKDVGIRSPAPEPKEEETKEARPPSKDTHQQHHTFVPGTASGYFCWRSCEAQLQDPFDEEEEAKEGLTFDEHKKNAQQKLVEFWAAQHRRCISRDR